jgi:hypothetical protein
VSQPAGPDFLIVVDKMQIRHPNNHDQEKARRMASWLSQRIAVGACEMT